MDEERVWKSGFLTALAEGGIDRAIDQALDDELETVSWFLERLQQSLMDVDHPLINSPVFLNKLIDRVHARMEERGIMRILLH